MTADASELTERASPCLDLHVLHRLHSHIRPVLCTEQDTEAAANLTERIYALEGAQKALCHSVQVSVNAQPADRGETRKKESLAGRSSAAVVVVGVVVRGSQGGGRGATDASRE